MSAIRQGAIHQRQGLLAAVSAIALLVSAACDGDSAGDRAGISTGGGGGTAGAGGASVVAGGAGWVGGTGAAGAAAGAAGSSASGGNAGVSGASGSGSGGSPTGGSGGSAVLDPPALDLNTAVWLHKDISAWTETVTISSVQFTGNLICLNHDIASQQPAWLPGNPGDPNEVVGNAWVFIWRDKKWQGATFEYLRPGQTCKFSAAVEGAHIKSEPFLSEGWKPTSGEVLYFMVSGLARFNAFPVNAAERSNPIRVVWP